MATPFLQIYGAGSNFLPRFFQHSSPFLGLRAFFVELIRSGCENPLLVGRLSGHEERFSFSLGWSGAESCDPLEGWAKSPLPLQLGRKGAAGVPAPAKEAVPRAQRLVFQTVPELSCGSVGGPAVEKLGSPQQV